MRGSRLALSVFGDVVFGGREVGGVLGESAMMSTGVLGGSVVCGGVVMVGGRTGLVVAGLVGGWCFGGGDGGGDSGGIALGWCVAVAVAGVPGCAVASLCFRTCHGER